MRRTDKNLRAFHAAPIDLVHPTVKRLLPPWRKAATRRGRGCSGGVAAGLCVSDIYGESEFAAPCPTVKDGFLGVFAGVMSR